MSTVNSKMTPYKIFSLRGFAEAIKKRHIPSKTKLPAKRLTLPLRLIIPKE